MHLKNLLTLITIVLLAAAPMQAVQCALSCASMSVHTGPQGEQQLAMGNPPAHCAMHGRRMNPSQTGVRRAEATHQTARGHLPKNACAIQIRSNCRSDCGVVAAALCSGHTTAIVGLPTTIVLPDNALQMHIGVVALVQSNPPPALMHATPEDTALRQNVSTSVSLTINFRV